MTWTTDDPMARDETRPARSVRAARTRRTVAGAVLGALLLGGAGAAYAAGRAAPVSASALVVTSPDPAAVENPANPSASGDPGARNATYLETELVYLRGADLGEQVAAELGGSPPELEAARVGNSNVIEITSTAPDREAAVQQAQTATDLYVQGRQQRLTARITAQLAAVEQQLAETTQAQADLGQAPTSGADPQQQRRLTLGQQYADQLEVRDTLQRAVIDAPGVASQVQGATALPAGAVPPAVVAGIGGGALGALLGAALAQLLRRAGGRLRDEQDVADLGAPLLSPSLPTRGSSNRSGNRNGELDRAVRLQALRMPSGPLAGGSLVVLAPTAGVGTSFTALEHARHAARRGPTLLVCASGTVHDGLADLGVDPELPGLLDLLPAPGESVSSGTLVRVSQPTRVPDLRVLTPGAAQGADLRGAERVMAANLVRAAGSAGWAVVVDAAPIDRSDMGLQLARECDEAVVVVSARKSTVDDVARTLEIIRSAGAPLTGVIVNRPPRRAPSAGSRPEPVRAAERRPVREQVDGV